MTVKRGSQLLWSFSMAMGLMLQLYSASDVSEVRPVNKSTHVVGEHFSTLNFGSFQRDDDYLLGRCVITIEACPLKK
jgi:hypothetical protein